jgi:hypothetical protein
MMKTAVQMKESEIEAKAVLEELLARVPNLQAVFATEVRGDIPNSTPIDIVVKISSLGREAVLVCEVKSNGQPKTAEPAIYKLKRDMAGFGPNPVPVFAAPFLSEQVRQLCETEGVSYFDLAGNARIAFDGVYIERHANDNPFREKREFRTLFAPKAASVLRRMLKTEYGRPELETGPWRQWRVEDLKQEAAVSLGLVSNVRKALIQQGFASDQSQGVVLTKPAALLEAWRKEYQKPEGETYCYYTTLHGNQLNAAMRDILNHSVPTGQAVLASFSAAKWIAPYARIGAELFYADKLGRQRLERALQLTPSGAGANVQITVLKDEGPIWDAVETAEGIWCTSPVQTYLDLSIAGDRGVEAADFLKQKVLPWA